MRGSSRRGLSIAEVLVYSFLAGMVGLLLVRFLSDYYFISSSFNARNSLNTAATQLFSIFAADCERSNARAVQVSADGQLLSIQKIDSVDSLARTVWKQELEIYWYDSDKKTVFHGTISFDEGGIESLLYSPQTVSDTQREDVRQWLINASRVRALARNVTEFRFEKPGAEGLFVRMKLSQPTRGNRTETAERQHSFLLLSDREI